MAKPASGAFGFAAEIAGRAFIFFRVVSANPGPCNVDAPEETVVENPRCWVAG